MAISSQGSNHLRLLRRILSFSLHPFASLFRFRIFLCVFFHSVAKSSIKTAVKWQASQAKDHLSSQVSVQRVSLNLVTESSWNFQNIYVKIENILRRFKTPDPTLHNFKILIFLIVYLLFQPWSPRPSPSSVFSCATQRSSSPHHRQLTSPPSKTESSSSHRDWKQVHGRTSQFVKRGSTPWSAWRSASGSTLASALANDTLSATRSKAENFSKFSLLSIGICRIRLRKSTDYNCPWS